jgi:predicted nucleic acid-binding protein
VNQSANGLDKQHLFLYTTHSVHDGFWMDPMLKSLAVLRALCILLYSEDLHNGHQVDSVKVVSPLDGCL